MAQTKLNMLLQVRRDEVFNPSYVLQPGEPGFEISTNIYKLGDGQTTWENLSIANEDQIKNFVAAGLADAQKYTDDEAAKKVDKVEGYSLVADTEIARLAEVDNYDDTALAGRVTDLETASATHALKTEVEAVDAKVDALKITTDENGINLDDKATVNGDLNVTGREQTVAHNKNTLEVGATFEYIDLTKVLYNDGVRGVTGDITINFMSDRGFPYTLEISNGVSKIHTSDSDMGYFEDYYIFGSDNANGADTTFDTKWGGKNNTYTIDSISMSSPDIVVTYEDGKTVEGSVFDLIPIVMGNSIVGGDVYTNGKKLATENYVDEKVGSIDLSAAVNEAKAYTDTLANTRVKAIEDDYLKAADKEALQEQITTNANAITTLTDGIDPDKIDGLTDLVNWANEHAPEVASIKEDIEANTAAIEAVDAKVDGLGITKENGTVNVASGMNVAGDINIISAGVEKAIDNTADFKVGAVVNSLNFKSNAGIHIGELRDNYELKFKLPSSNNEYDYILRKEEFDNLAFKDYSGNIIQGWNCEYGWGYSVGGYEYEAVDNFVFSEPAIITSIEGFPYISIWTDELDDNMEPVYAGGYIWRIMDLMSIIDTHEKVATETVAKNYTDSALTEAKTYTDTKLAEANTYTDTKVGEANTYIDTKVAEANTYTDTKVAEVVGNLDVLEKITVDTEGNVDVASDMQVSGDISVVSVGEKIYSSEEIVVGTNVTKLIFKDVTLGAVDGVYTSIRFSNGWRFDTEPDILYFGEDEMSKDNIFRTTTGKWDNASEYTFDEPVTITRIDAISVGFNHKITDIVDFFGQGETLEKLATEAIVDTKINAAVTAIDTGVTKVEAGTDIVVSPEEGTGNVTVAHKAYSTGVVKDATHDSATDPSFLTSVTIENGHVTGATVQNLATVLAGMTFIFDGGNSTN